MELCEQARAMLKAWESNYFDVRQKIEVSDRGERWEFDRTRLFDTTNYMAGICQDLQDMSQVCTRPVWCLDPPRCTCSCPAMSHSRACAHA